MTAEPAHSTNVIRSPLPLIIACLVGVVTVSGCGGASSGPGRMHQVKGKVVFTKDQAALSGLKIEFIKASPGARNATGEIRPDGSFELKSEAGDGIPEGNYTLRLIRPVSATGKAVVSPIPPAYFEDDGGFIPVTIQADTTELPPLEIKPAKKK